MDQKMIKTLGMVIAGFAVFIIILFLVASCSGGNYTFEKLEEDMIEVAKKYYEKNEDELPQQDKDTKSLTLKKMISDGEIKELTELFDNEEIDCDGNVTVINNNGYYLYSPYLSCGEDFETKYLADKIIEDSLVEEGVGLYSVNDRYIMKGEKINNYVTYNEKIYRIIGINDDGTIRLIEQKGIPYKTWDDRYNADYKYASGINEYVINSINSRIKDTLEEYYEGDFPEELRPYVTSQTLCIGKRAEADITKDGSTECSLKLEEQMLGLLTTYEYLQTSLEPTCVATLDRSCRNYNWLGDFDTSLWLLTADAESSRYVYALDGSLSKNNASGYSSINAVFNISEKTIYVSGEGTEEDPYVFR